MNILSEIKSKVFEVFTYINFMMDNKLIENFKLG